MKKNKVLWAVSITAVVLVVIAGYLIFRFVIKNGVGADVANQSAQSSKYKALVDIRAHTDVVLPANISNADAVKALSRSQNGVYSAGVNETKNRDTINKAIDAKITELSNKAKAAGLTSKDIGDLIINTKDSKGIYVIPQQVKSAAAAPTNVADNFIFDSSVSQNLKNIHLTYYPKIEQVYGRRSSNSPIKITVDKKLQFSAYYNTIQNQIVYGYDIGSVPETTSTVVHEMTHAFHGAFLVMLPLPFEEGSASFIGNLLTGGKTDFFTLKDYELINTPFISGYNVGIYTSGISAISKIYQEDNNFFVKFNKELYSHGASSSYSPALATDVLSNTIPKIEGINTRDWIRKQYLLDFYASLTSNGETIMQSWSSPVIYRDGDWSVAILAASGYQSFSGGTVVNSYQVSIFNINNNLLFRKTFSPYESISYQNFDGKLNNYEGILKVVISPNANPKEQRVQYFGISNLNSNNNLKVSLWGLTTVQGTLGKVTNLDTGKSATVTIRNGLFYLINPDFERAGRYRVDIYSIAGRILAQHYFNSYGGRGYVTLIQGDSPARSVNITANAYQGNCQGGRSCFTIKVTISDYFCNLAVIADNYRATAYPDMFWGTSYGFEVFPESMAAPSLVRGRQYLWKINASCWVNNGWIDKTITGTYTASEI